MVYILSIFKSANFFPPTQTYLPNNARKRHFRQHPIPSEGRRFKKASSIMFRNFRPIPCSIAPRIAQELPKTFTPPRACDPISTRLLNYNKNQPMPYHHRSFCPLSSLTLPMRKFTTKSLIYHYQTTRTIWVRPFSGNVLEGPQLFYAKNALSAEMRSELCIEELDVSFLSSLFFLQMRCHVMSCHVGLGWFYGREAKEEIANGTGVIDE